MFRGDYYSQKYVYSGNTPQEGLSVAENINLKLRLAIYFPWFFSRLVGTMIHAEFICMLGERQVVKYLDVAVPMHAES